MTGTAAAAYIEFRNLILDGFKNSTSAKAFIPVNLNRTVQTSQTVHDIYFYGCELRNSAQSSGLIQESTTTPGAGIPYNLLFAKDPTTNRRGLVYNNGVSLAQHGMYLQGRNNIIEDTDAYDNFGLGLQVHKDASGSDNCKDITFRRCRVWGNGQTGIYYGRGSGGKIYNCLAFDNITHGLRFDDAASNGEIYNCTSIRNITSNFTTGASAAVTNIAIRNCIAYKLGVSGVNLQDNTQNPTIQTCINVAIADTDATNPLFVDAANDNFQLLAGSPCRDAGTDLSASGLIDDLLGVSRPQGAAYDIGAYEFVTAGGIPRGILMPRRNVHRVYFC
jgi:hypothetical protein